MTKNLEEYKHYIFISIILIALGVTFSSTMKEVVGSLGVVFIAVGGLFFIIGMRIKKRQEDIKKNLSSK